MKYPVAYFDEKFSYVELIKDEKLLSKTNSLALKNGSLLKGKIVDCEGIMFKITDIQKLGNVNPFWKFEFFNPLINIQMSAKQDGSMPLDKFKSRLLKILRNNRDLWDADGELEEKIAFIETAESCQGIIEYLTDKVYT